LFAWGQFMINNQIIFDYAKPTQLSKNIKFEQVSVGSSHILAVNENKQVIYKKHLKIII